MSFWSSSGFNQLTRNARGWLIPTDAYLRLYLSRPELALVPESCPAETTLHAALAELPSRAVSPGELDGIEDADAQDNYRMFLGFRDALLSAGTLEGYYLQLFQQGVISIPPLFVDLIAQAIARNILDASQDAFEVRAAEMLFRPQRISVQDGQILAGDQSVLDLYNETAGLGDLGRLLLEAKAPLNTVTLEVLTTDNAVRYWQRDERHTFLLDLTHEVTKDLSHGLSFSMTRARSGLTALAKVLEKWTTHFLGVVVTIRPEQQISDEAWRWHVGLDTESTALLNDLYEDRPVEPERMQRLVSLFRLEFANPLEMRADVAGKPVYLGLATNNASLVRLKPQNLLLNLPLAASM